MAVDLQLLVKLIKQMSFSESDAIGVDTMIASANCKLRLQML